MNPIVTLPDPVATQAILWGNVLPAEGKLMLERGLLPSYVLPLFTQTITGREVERQLWRTYTTVAKTYGREGAVAFMDHIVEVCYGSGYSWEKLFRATALSPVKITYGDYAVARATLAVPVVELNRSVQGGFHNACGIVGPMIALTTWWLGESADVHDKQVRSSMLALGSVDDALQTAQAAAGIFALLLDVHA